MEKQEIIHQLTRAIIIEFEMKIDSIEVDEDFVNDLGLDSLNIVDMVILTEKIFDIRITSEEVQGIRTLNQLADMVILKIQTK